MFAATKKSPLNKALSDKRDAKQILEESHKKNRDRLCVPPKYPGKPEDYKYIASEYCKLKKRHAAATKEIARKIPAAQTQREIKIIQNILKLVGNTGYKMSGFHGDEINVILDVFDMMIDIKGRKMYPDPATRYSHAVQRLFQEEGYKTEKVNATQTYYPVLTLVLSHLVHL